jgi:hypothetical protein
LVVNLRAEAPPTILTLAFEALKDRHDELHLEHVECFEPGQPDPTHRMTYETGEATPASATFGSAR